MASVPPSPNNWSPSFALPKLPSVPSTPSRNHNHTVRPLGMLSNKTLAPLSDASAARSLNKSSPSSADSDSDACPSPDPSVSSYPQWHLNAQSAVPSTSPEYEHTNRTTSTHPSSPAFAPPPTKPSDPAFSLNPFPPSLLPSASASGLGPSHKTTSSPSGPSHHYSPSTIAQLILKTASSALVSQNLSSMDMDQVAAKDDDTAEAMRKLDGLSAIPLSPKVARPASKDHAYCANRGSRSNSSVGHSHHSRRSTISRPNSPSSSTGRERVHHKDKHKPAPDDQTSVSSKKGPRSLVSVKDSLSPPAQADQSPNLPPDVAPRIVSSQRSNPRLASPSSAAVLNPHPSPSSVATTAQAGGPSSISVSSWADPSPRPPTTKATEGSARSSLVALSKPVPVGSGPPIHSPRRSSHSKSSGWLTDASRVDAHSGPVATTNPQHSEGFPPSSASAKRGSSSSANCTAGTHLTLDSSRDTSLTALVSTSVSLVSLGNFATVSNRSPTASKSRNSLGYESGSVSGALVGMDEVCRVSDSSINSSSTNAEHGNSQAMLIPPVPPLPKDYETIRLSNLDTPLNRQARYVSQTSFSQPASYLSRGTRRPSFQVAELSPSETGPISPSPSVCNATGTAPAHPPRFLNLINSPRKTSEDSPSPHSVSLIHQGPSPSSVPNKASKKWSLSAALGINKSSSFTRDSFEDPASSSSANSPNLSNHSHHPLTRVATSSSRKREPLDPEAAKLGGGEAAQFLASEAIISPTKRASWVSSGALHSPPVFSNPSLRHMVPEPHACEPPYPNCAPSVSRDSSATGLSHMPSIGDTFGSASKACGVHQHQQMTPPKAAGGLGSALSSRRTPSGIPFFSSRKSSGAQNNQSAFDLAACSNHTTSTISQDSSHSAFKPAKSPKADTKNDGEGGGRRSMMALNAFIRNSVQRRPALTSNPPQPTSSNASLSSLAHQEDSFTSESTISQSLHSVMTEKGYKSKRASGLHDRKKLSVNIPASRAADVELPVVASPARRTTLGSKASHLISRRRGKTVSVTEATKKGKMPPPLPPLQMSAIHPTTVQRVNSMNSMENANSPSSSVRSKRRSGDYTHSSSLSSRPIANRIRTLKESTTSMRKAALPTIDASPLRAADGPSTDVAKSHLSRQQQNESASDLQSPLVYNPPTSVTPTKIPRAVFRVQKNESPIPKGRVSDQPMSLKADDDPTSSKLSIGSKKDRQESSQENSDGVTNAHDFGVLASRQSFAVPSSAVVTKRGSDVAVNGMSGSLIPRTRSGTSISNKSFRRISNADLKAENLNPLPFSPMKTSDTATLSHRRLSGGFVQAEVVTVQDPSTGSCSSPSSAAARLAAARRTVAKTQDSQAARTSSRRQSSQGTTAHLTDSVTDHSTVSEFGIAANVGGIPPSKSSRTLASKLTLPSRISRSSTTPSLGAVGCDLNPTTPSRHRLTVGYGQPSPSGLRESFSTTPPVSEEELKGDEEMKQYVSRQRNKKLVSGMTPSEVDRLFEFPKPVEPVRPMTNQEALRLYRSYLSAYEKEEILGYQEIYYVGAESEKKMNQAASAELDPSTGKELFNYGYDDDRGDYQIVKNDHLVYRYEVVELLGKGSFGQVLECRDHKSGHMVAVKIIRNKKRFHHQALVEIKVLENLVKWDPDDRHCVLKMMDHFSFRGHLCIVNELLSINLYELIRNNSFNGFSVDLIRRFTSQILLSLSLLRHHRVVHCDLKPENILLKHPQKSAIKTIDFGSSCFENEKVYTYIQSRFYRSPEVILGMNYHMAIDMWSLGCILAELHTGYPIFPGETESEQLACIMEVLGMPDKYLVDRSSRRKLFFDSSGAPRPVVNSKGRRRRVGSKTLQSVLKTNDDLFLDFISKCLAWDPERRLKPDPAMRHPWIVAGRAATRSSHMSTPLSHASISSRLASRGASSIITISSPRRKTVQTGTSTYHTNSNGITPSSSSTVIGGSTAGNLTSSTTTTSSYRLRTQSNTHRHALKSSHLQIGSNPVVGAGGGLRQSVPVQAGP